MIYLKEITKDNLFDVIKLSETLDEKQKRCVAHNAVSIAEAYVKPQAWPRAIYDDETLVGFVMLALHDDDIIESDQPSYLLWRFMIAKPYQNKGYGKKVLYLIMEKARQDKQKYLYASCMVEDAMPLKFYLSYGFEDTHEKDGDEEIIKKCVSF
jgi:diamine N-acetyltransferase